MGVRNWNVKEQFCFPESFGMPKGVKSLNVTPQYIHRQVEDAVEVQGIYHITCEVEFDREKVASYTPSDFTQIDDLDLEGEVGYFEYAVPMYEIIDERIQSHSEPVVSLKEIESKTEDKGLEITWSVNLEYETSKPEHVEPKPVSPPTFFESSSVKIFESINHNHHDHHDHHDHQDHHDHYAHQDHHAHHDHHAPSQMPQEEPKIRLTETKLESPAFVDSELEFIHSLEDGYSKVVFPSNNIFRE